MLSGAIETSRNSGRFGRTPRRFDFHPTFHSDCSFDAVLLGAVSAAVRPIGRVDVSFLRRGAAARQLTRRYVLETLIVADRREFLSRRFSFRDLGLRRSKARREPNCRTAVPAIALGWYPVPRHHQPMRRVVPSPCSREPLDS
jgi:hypothetical protein